MAPSPSSPAHAPAVGGLGHWPVLAAARNANQDHGLPFCLRQGLDGLVRVGQVRRGLVDSLIASQPGPPGALTKVEAGLVPGQGLAAGPALVLDLPQAQRDAWFAALHADLRARGLLTGWRDELFPLLDPATGAVLAHIERAAARLWGSLTRGAHCNGIVPGATPAQDQLWLGRRSASKSTDPGLLDNLVGGGVPLGQSPWEALQREGFEEAGLAAELMQTARAGAVYRIQRDIPEGLQFEDIHVHDLALPAGLQPRNQDGEVAEFILLSPAQALARVQAGELTVDASLATLDCAWRRGWLPACLDPAEATALAAALATLAHRPATQALQPPASH